MACTFDKSIISLFSALVLALMILVDAHAHPDEVIQITTTQNDDAPTTDKYGKPLWEIDAGVPFIGSPVHEKMAMASVSISNIHRRKFDTNKDEAYIHGVFWNDDPKDLLCPECSTFNLRKFDKRWGITFARRFTMAKKKARESDSDSNNNKLVYSVGDGLLERSHFGDLQFLHAMASRNCELAEETQAKILSWAKFTYKVSIGVIPQKTKLHNIPIKFIRELFASDQALADLKIESLFKGRKFARRVAIGSLLHMIQDSYALGHAKRKILDCKSGDRIVFARGSISEFHSYTHQDEKLHANDDQWPDGLDINSPTSPNNPISVGVKLLKFMQNRAPWSEVEKYLSENVFAIENPNNPAGPGEQYRRLNAGAIHCE